LFFEIYLLDENKLIVLIDKTGWCLSPLFLYKSKKRLIAFQAALNDIKHNLPDIINLIKKATEFNESLHCKLEHLFSY